MCFALTGFKGNGHDPLVHFLMLALGTTWPYVPGHIFDPLKRNHKSSCARRNAKTRHCQVATWLAGCLYGLYSKLLSEDSWVGFGCANKCRTTCHPHTFCPGCWSDTRQRNGMLSNYIDASINIGSFELASGERTHVPPRCGATPVAFSPSQLPLSEPSLRGTRRLGPRLAAGARRANCFGSPRRKLWGWREVTLVVAAGRT